MPQINYHIRRLDVNLKVNDTISVSKINNNQITIYQDNCFKTLECDYEILNEILHLVKEFGNREEIYKKFGKYYSIEEIDQFIDVLITEGILLNSKELNSTHDYDKSHILLISDTEINKEIKDFFVSKIDVDVINDVYAVEKAIKSSDFVCVFLIKSNIKYKDVIWLNKLLINANIPFVILRNDGVNLISGPFIFPMKSACYECIIQHHIDRLNENSENKISIENIKNLYVSKNLDFYSNKTLFNLCLNKIESDILNLRKNKVNFYYFQKEEIWDLKSKELKTCVYYPTTNCSACNGMTRELIEIDKSKNVVVPRSIKLFNDSSKEIKYFKGGLRSVSPEETQNTIEKALNKINININLTRVNNKLKNILPVYRANVDVTHKNNTPYFIQYQRSFGKGITEQQALFSCTFELMERLSSHYYGDIPLLRAKPSDIKNHIIDISSTTNQIKQIYDRYEDYDENMEVDWVWGQSLISNQPKLIPASRVFLTGVKFKGDFVPVGSSGLSSGVTIEDAILQGLFEVIEHDAWCIGQSNIIKLPIIDYSTVKKETTKDLISKIQNEGFRIISRDYTNDIDIPTIRTWIIDENNYIEYATNGFGSSIDPEIALERSITEAVQGKLPPIQSRITEYGRKNLTGLINSRDSIFNLGYFKFKDMDLNSEKMKSMDEFKQSKFETLEETLNFVVSKVNKATNGDVLFVDLTNQNLGGIPSVKVVVTGDIQIVSEPLLCPSNRMLKFKKIMGYSDEGVKYTDLFLGDYPH